MVTNPQTTAVPNAAPPAHDLATQFLHDNRIHIEGGSLFTNDHYLMVHPRELAPENQQRLFGKLVKHYSIPSPPFYAFSPRNLVMLQLAQFLPISREARLESIEKTIQELQQEAESGIHPDSSKQIELYEKPLAGFVKSRTEEPEIDAVAKNYLQNATALYLLINEALRQDGRTNEAASYISMTRSADSILGELSPLLGTDIETFARTANTEGLKGLATLLKVDAATLQEIETVSAMASENEFSNNLLMSWDVGRHMPGMENRSVEEKIGIGTLQRAGAKLHELKQQLDPNKPLPKDVLKQEQLIVAMIRELPKELQEAIYYSGTELAFCNGPGIAKINPSIGRALGVNLHASFEVGGSNGLRQIMVSSLDNVQDVRRFFHHEAHHHFFPKQLDAASLERMEQLIEKGSARLNALKEALDAWKVAPEQLRPELEARINDQFKVGAIGLNEALGRHSDQPISMDTLRGWVDHAVANLTPHSLRLTRGYPSPESRTAELVSRYSELMYVDLADDPLLLSFVAPEMTVLYHDHYLPHLAKQVELDTQEQQRLPENLRFIGLPPNLALPQTQQEALEMKQPDIDHPDQPRTQVAAASIRNHIEVPQGISRYMEKVEASHQSVVEANAGKSELSV